MIIISLQNRSRTLEFAQKGARLVDGAWLSHHKFAAYPHVTMCQRVPSYDPRRSERGVVATSSKRLCVGISCCVFALIAIIVTISLVASSFAKVDEGEACMQYSDYTGVLEDEVVLEPTNAFVGPSSDFHCYPKIVQEIEVRRGSSPRPCLASSMCSPTVLRCFWRGVLWYSSRKGARV